MDFYKRLNYSLGNEDWVVEEQALRVTNGDRVICITASGDRPLHLLMTDCAEIISIDMNSAQNYLLALKICAIKQLEYDKYLAFLGCEDTPHRHAIFLQLTPHLTKDTAAYWEKNIRMIKRGIIYQGRTERFTQLAAKFFHLVRRRKIKKLFSFTQLESQRDYVENEWDTRAWRKLFAVLMHPKISRYLINDPSFAYSDYAHPGIYISERIRGYLDTHLAIKSPLLQLLLNGSVAPDAYFPYLTYDGYTKIRARPERLNYLTANIVDYLEQLESGSIDAFSLSDIASYMPQMNFEKLLHAMKHAGRPGARFCLREFTSKREVPVALHNNLRRDALLEKKLEAEETNFVYRFIVGHINK
jgi:S-adenosylmethionine-diacylglycerol 3-amino-3-carboxypropyl transferase